MDILFEVYLNGFLLSYFTALMSYVGQNKYNFFSCVALAILIGFGSWVSLFIWAFEGENVFARIASRQENTHILTAEEAYIQSQVRKVINDINRAISDGKSSIEIAYSLEEEAAKELAKQGYTVIKVTRDVTYKNEKIGERVNTLISFDLSKK